MVESRLQCSNNTHWHSLIFLSSQLILSERGWFRNKASVLHEGEGNIRTIKWRSSLIAWANDAVSQNIRKAPLIVFRPVLIMMAKLMKTLELYFPRIQVFITLWFVCFFQEVKMFDMNSQRVITHIKREPGKYVQIFASQQQFSYCLFPLRNKHGYLF